MFKYGLSLKKKGKNFFAKCPFHTNTGATQELTASLAILNGKGFYHCFGCGASGKISELNEEVKQLSIARRKEFIESMKNKKRNKEMFKEYQSKPITRKAAKIGNEELIYWPEKSSAMYEGVVFKCYEEPKKGDYIVYLNEDDIYHCSEKVFKDRNIV